MSFRLNFDHHVSYDDERDRGISIPVRLSANDRSCLITAKLDTGCDFCIFERRWGDWLGLDIESGSERVFRTMAGNFVTHQHAVIVETCGIQFESVVYFARDGAVSRSFVGRGGWLDHFRLAIVHYERDLFLSLYEA